MSASGGSPSVMRGKERESMKMAFENWSNWYLWNIACKIQLKWVNSCSKMDAERGEKKILIENYDSIFNNFWNLSKFCERSGRNVSSKLWSSPFLVCVLSTPASLIYFLHVLHSHLQTTPSGLKRWHLSRHGLPHFNIRWLLCLPGSNLPLGLRKFWPAVGIISRGAKLTFFTSIFVTF